ncbi:MAG: CRISPR-associated endonuclease Cas2 [bacterium]
MLYIIAYDIADDNKRNKISGYLAGWGRRIQKSIFECDLDREELNRVVSYIRGLINEAQDRCNIYRLCAECASCKTIFGSDLEPAWEKTIVI